MNQLYYLMFMAMSFCICISPTTEEHDLPDSNVFMCQMISPQAPGIQSGLQNWGFGSEILSEAKGRIRCIKMGSQKPTL